MHRCLCWVLGVVNQCNDRERIFFLSSKKFDLQKEHVGGGPVAGQPRNEETLTFSDVAPDHKPQQPRTHAT